MFRTKMFRRRLIENSDGYSVEFPDRASVRYRDERYTLILGIEHLSTPGGLCIFPAQLWNDADPRTLMEDENVRTMVVARAKAAFEFQHFNVEVA
jgi:hypothetical protein